MYFSGNIQVTRAIHGLVIPHNTHKLSISSISSSSRTSPSARSKFSSSSRAKGSARSNSIISSFEQGSPVRVDSNSTRLQSHLCAQPKVGGSRILKTNLETPIKPSHCRWSKLHKARKKDANVARTVVIFAIGRTPTCLIIIDWDNTCQDLIEGKHLL